MDVWNWTLDARRSLLTTFEGLDSDQWEVASLSDGWTVREVLAHLILAARPPMRRYGRALVTARGDFDAANRALAVADAQRPVEQLLDDYRAVIDHRFGPPGWPAAAPLGDVLLHALDVRIPLGLASVHSEPAEHYVPVMDLLHGRAGRSFSRRGRPTVCWTATDVEWVHGEGPEVRGRMEDLVLAASGRSPRLDRLDGEGAAALRTWLT